MVIIFSQEQEQEQYISRHHAFYFHKGKHLQGTWQV